MESIRAKRSRPFTSEKSVVGNADDYTLIAFRLCPLNEVRQLRVQAPPSSPWDAAQMFPGMNTFCILTATDSQITASARDPPSILSHLSMANYGKPGWRCGRHGPFPCSCNVLFVLGARLHRLLSECASHCIDTSNDSNFDDCIRVEEDPIRGSNRPRQPLIRLAVSTPQQQVGEALLAQGGTLSVEFHSPIFPFPVPHSTGGIIRLRRSTDSLECIHKAVLEGWRDSAGVSSSDRREFPSCSNCSRVAPVTTGCQFCERKWCAKCSRRCPSCRQTFCCVQCSQFEMIDRVAMSLCPACVEY